MRKLTFACYFNDQLHVTIWLVSWYLNKCRTENYGDMVFVIFRLFKTLEVKTLSLLTRHPKEKKQNKETCSEEEMMNWNGASRLEVASVALFYNCRLVSKIKTPKISTISLQVFLAVRKYFGGASSYLSDRLKYALAYGL